MSDLVGNPEDRFSRVEAQIIGIHLNNLKETSDGQIASIYKLCEIHVLDSE